MKETFEKRKQHQCCSNPNIRERRQTPLLSSIFYHLLLKAAFKAYLHTTSVYNFCTSLGLSPKNPENRFSPIIRGGAEPLPPPGKRQQNVQTKTISPRRGLLTCLGLDRLRNAKFGKNFLLGLHQQELCWRQVKGLPSRPAVCASVC